MKRIVALILIMASFTSLFVLAKPAFMLYNGAIGQGAQCSDFLEVICHGLTLDVCVAAFATLPFLLLASLPRVPLRPASILALLLAALFSLAIVADACLYEFWDIKLDATVLAYLDSPRGVTSSVSTLFLIISLLVWIILTAITAFVQHIIIRWGLRNTLAELSPQQRGFVAGGYLLLTAFLVLSMRGLNRLFATPAHDAPLSVASAYYSPRQLFNHSAVNPVFSFLTSVGNRTRGISPDSFMPPAQADSIFRTLHYNTDSRISSSDSLLTASFIRSFRRGEAQIVLIIMEGCGGTLVSEVCGTVPELTPCLNRLCSESVFFQNCYANSFRTDRGVLCALSGYPAFPDVSLMRQSGKVATLSGIADALKQSLPQRCPTGEAPLCDFLYGGDRDFTSMASYLRATGYDHVWGDVDFPESQRRTHNWGVTDSLTFLRLRTLTGCYRAHKGPSQPPQSPFLTFLTLASHEPWEVPYKRMMKKGKIANSFAYLDHCLDGYLRYLRRSPAWERTLVILTSDHGIAWPAEMSEANPSRYHIPMIWTGGAIRAPRRIAQICNQTDLPATLLGQLGVAHDDFPFSRDVMSQTYTFPCAQHAWAEGFAFIDSTGHTVIDLHTMEPLSDVNTSDSPEHPLPLKEAQRQRRLRALRAKAFLQTAYRDMEQR